MKFCTSLAAIVAFSLTLSSCGPSDEEKRRAAIEKENEMIAMTMSKIKEAELKAKAEEDAKIEVFQTMVRDKFNDPASTQFRKVKLVDGGKEICGEVNTKNNRGGYEGFKPFAMTADANFIYLNEIPPVDMKDLSNKTKMERKKYIEEYYNALLVAGLKSKALLLLMDIEEMEKFTKWGECFN